jgi:hypothetical protein
MMMARTCAGSQTTLTFYELWGNQMNPNVSQAIVEILIMARKLQEISASSNQEKEIFEGLFRIGEAAYAGMTELKRDE